MRASRAVLLVALLGGCTSVRLVQRDGCWVRQSSNAFHKVSEEIGPCARPAPQWAEDRVTRLVQECVVRADYQWQTRALASWNRRDPLPPQDPEEKVLRDCMGESSRVMAEENATLKARLAETAAERDALRVSTEADRAHLRTTLDKVTEQLGDAAKKPLPPAIATATSSSEGRGGASAPAAAPAPTSVMVLGAPPTQAAQPTATPPAAPGPVSCAPGTVVARPSHGGKKVSQPLACEAPR